jgi:hypothetical protein
MVGQVDENKRRAWLRALRQFKYGMQVRAKLGVLQTLCDQVAAERAKQKQWDQPAWEHDKWLTLLYTSIKDTAFPPELLIGFVKTAEVTFMASNQQPTVVKTLNAVDKICKQHSRTLRIKFGVLH